MPDIRLLTWTIIIGLVIIGAYMVLKKLFIHTLFDRPSRQNILAIIQFLEKVFWPFYLICIGFSLIISHPTVGISLCLFITVTLWKPIHNYFMGLIFVAGKTYSVGQRIKYNDLLGTIKAFHNISIELELDGGESMEVPYQDFANSSVIKTSPQSGVTSHTMIVNISKPCDLEKEKQKMQAMLIALPWVLPSQKIGFEQLSDEDDLYKIKVIVHGLDKDHLLKVENKLQSLHRT
jgi:small-conductance mechanosensitive channel